MKQIWPHLQPNISYDLTIHLKLHQILGAAGLMDAG